MVLRGNPIGDEGARALATALRGGGGGSGAAVADKACGVRVLDLGEAGVTAAGALELAAAARASAELRVRAGAAHPTPHRKREHGGGGGLLPLQQPVSLSSGLPLRAALSEVKPAAASRLGANFIFVYHPRV